VSEYVALHSTVPQSWWRRQGGPGIHLPRWPEAPDRLRVLCASQPPPRDDPLTLRNRAVPFSLQLPVLHQVVKHRSGRVRQPALYPPPALLRQISRHARERPSRSRRADERVEVTSVGLLPDLRASGDDVGVAVRDVVELVGPDGVIEGLGESGGLVVVVHRVVECDGYEG
jgi:hypothetical protein